MGKRSGSPCKKRFCTLALQQNSFFTGEMYMKFLHFSFAVKTVYQEIFPAADQPVFLHGGVKRFSGGDTRNGIDTSGTVAGK